LIKTLMKMIRKFVTWGVTLGLPSYNTLFPALVLKQNIVELPTSLLKLLGCISYLKNFSCHPTELLLFTATT
jgi:hypothetical protein